MGRRTTGGCRPMSPKPCREEKKEEKEKRPATETLPHGLQNAGA